MLSIRFHAAKKQSELLCTDICPSPVSILIIKFTNLCPKCQLDLDCKFRMGGAWAEKACQSIWLHMQQFCSQTIKCIDCTRPTSEVFFICRMVLVLNGVLQEECPLDTHSLFMQHPVYRDTANQLLSIPIKTVKCIKQCPSKHSSIV